MIDKLNKIKRKILGPLFIDTCVGDYTKTVILAGSGRSGTTWVEEVINYQQDYRIIFEPFHSQKNNLLKEWNYRQYLRTENNDERFLIPTQKILSGNFRLHWSDQYNEKFFFRKRLLKDIRIHLFLYWIKHHFPEIPIMLLLRPPCAVANSKLKLSWQTHLDDFLRQDDLVQDFLAPFKKYLENLTDPFEKHIAMWCIENYVPLKQFNSGEILVVFYEHLCTDPKQEIEKIMLFLHNDFSSSIFEQIKKPSALSRKESPIVSGANLIDSWRKNVTETQVQKAVEILNIFGLNSIYNHENIPLINGDKALTILK